VKKLTFVLERGLTISCISQRTDEKFSIVIDENYEGYSEFYINSGSPRDASALEAPNGIPFGIIYKDSYRASMRLLKQIQPELVRFIDMSANGTLHKRKKDKKQL
jgi:hypothetical protein